MKTLKKIGLVLAAVLGISMLAGCDFSTLGMEQLEKSDVTNEWVNGTWDYSSTSVTYDSDKNSTKTTDSGTLDLTNVIVQTVYIATLQTYADNGELYANSARTKFVIKSVTYDSKTKATTAEYSATFTKNN